MGWMDDFDRMRRQWERLSKDLAPSIEIIRQFEHQHDWSRLQRELIPATMAAQEHFETLRRFAEPKYFTDLSALIARNQLDFDKLLALNLSSYQGQWASGLRAIQTLKNLAGPAALSSAAGEFVARSGGPSGGNAERESVAHEIEQTYLHEADRVQLNPATAQFILSILLSLLLFWLSQQSASDSEERILNRIGQIEAAIEETVGMLQSGSDGLDSEGTTRVVMRSTTVLTRPSGRSGRALGPIYKDQVVVVQGERGKWCKVEWFDLRDRSLKLGWVLKKYLGRARR